MLQTVPQENAVVTVCSRCGGVMRFVSSEPHATDPAVDLHTFGCTACDFTQVLTVRDGAKAPKH